MITWPCSNPPPMDCEVKLPRIPFLAIADHCGLGFLILLPAVAQMQPTILSKSNEFISDECVRSNHREKINQQISNQREQTVCKIAYENQKKSRRTVISLFISKINGINTTMEVDASTNPILPLFCANQKAQSLEN